MSGSARVCLACGEEGDLLSQAKSWRGRSGSYQIPIPSPYEAEEAVHCGQLL
ncbi:hypothetical protein BDV27DRAFT_139150, partial [Aspergillus caelatus]